MEHLTIKTEMTVSMEGYGQILKAFEVSQKLGETDTSFSEYKLAIKMMQAEVDDDFITLSLNQIEIDTIGSLMAYLVDKHYTAPIKPEDEYGAEVANELLESLKAFNLEYHKQL